MTLKVGSKVYDGLGNSYIIPNNIAKSDASGGDTYQLIIVKTDFSGFFWLGVSDTHATYNSATGMVSYDGSDIGYLPVGITTHTGSTYTSINQVFNGFGYIDSYIFALPGVKVLTPNGKNENGTYRTVERTINTVKTYNTGDWGTANLNIQFSGSVVSPYLEGQYVKRFTYNKEFSSHTSTYSYDENTGIWWYSADQSSWVEINNNIIGSCRVESGRITQFQVEAVDAVANSNASNFSSAGRSYLSSLGMPSGRYIDLTLSATGSTYTAPANGWFLISKVSTGVQDVVIDVNGVRWITSNSPDVGWTCSAFVPVIAGDIVRVLYSAGGALNFFRFIYAEGAE